MVWMCVYIHTPTQRERGLVFTERIHKRVGVFMDLMERRVGIIGAGVSGLLACKYVLGMGFEPVVFESKTGIGGVWAQTIKSTKLQSPKQAFEFSDFPWSSSVKEEVPDHNQVMDYFRSYIQHFDLLRYIKFNSQVISIDYEGPSDEEMAAWDLWGGTGGPFGCPQGIWKIIVKENHLEQIQVYQVDFVILCLGRFSDVPNMPDFPPCKGPEVFDGKVIHSMDYSAMDDAAAAEFIKGKQVTVVGIRKSATDIAMECAIANGVKHPCTVIFKKAHWTIPGFFAWGVPLPLLYFNRFAELLIHKPGEGLILSLLATLLSPLRWLITKFVESYLTWKYQLKEYNMIPTHSFNKDLSSCTISVLPDGFYDRVKEGSIVLKKTPGFSFCKEGLMIDGVNAPLVTDVVIFATGFKGDQKLRDIFASSTFQKYMMGGSSTTTVPLYRACLHPRIPQLAVVGHSESVANLYTAEMSCRWLAHFLKGGFKLPRIQEMEADVVRWAKYMKNYLGEYHSRSSISTVHIWHNDQLCKDMKCNPRRKKGYFAELFEPYGTMDYLNLA